MRTPIRQIGILRSSAAVVAVLLPVAGVSACGGSTSGPSAEEVAQAKAAALKTVTSYVDTDNCRLLAEPYLKSEFGGLSKCQADSASLKGVEKGGYAVVSNSGTADKVTIGIERKDESVMAITAEKQDGKWLITGKTERKPPKTETDVGQPLWLLSGVENPDSGKKYDVRLKITVKSASASDPPEFYEPTDGKKYWKARATVKSESGGLVFVDYGDFSLVSTSGERFDSSNEFSPALGGSAGSIDAGGLTPGSKYSGFLTFQVPEKTKIESVQFFSSTYATGDNPPLQWLVKR